MSHWYWFAAGVGVVLLPLVALIVWLEKYDTSYDQYDDDIRLCAKCGDVYDAAPPAAPSGENQ